MITQVKSSVGTTTLQIDSIKLIETVQGTFPTGGGIRVAGYYRAL